MTSTTEFPVVFDGRKYNIEKFVRDHPGGVNTLKYFKGRCVRQAMRNFGHSVSAYHMLQDFKVENQEMDSNLTGSVSKNGRIEMKEEEKCDPEDVQFLEELEGRLDWNKPLLNQLDAVAPHYEKWMNSAVYRRPRLFANPWLEALTLTPWYLVPLTWVPIIIYLGVTQYYQHVDCREMCEHPPISALQYLCNIVQGVVIWTAMEYSLHRWLFHLNPGSSLVMIKLHFLLHGLHHKAPFDGLRLVFPPVPGLLISYLILQGINVLPYPVIKLTGGIIGYLTYDMIHYYIHYGSPRVGTYLYAMKRYHSNHHFVNHDRAFGISCNIWDHVFKTYVKVKKLGFSLHW